MLTINVPSSDQQTCYFSLEPAAHQHFSTETPCASPTFSPLETPADPNHPLLASRELPPFNLATSPPASPPSTFLQMQTAAAHRNSLSRPRPYPVQNVLHVTSDDSTTSDSSHSSTTRSISSIDLARCSRCQRTPSIDIKTGQSNMVEYGLNLWYCTRCAAMVGLKNG